jgi:predicted RNA-binding protein with PIN domain
MMPIAVDGNNLLHRLPLSQRTRAEVRRQALEIVRNETVQVVIVFDGPPPRGAPATEHLGRVTIRYSGADSADDVIFNLIPGGRGASQWVVVTDDRDLGARVRGKGADVRKLAEWRSRRPPTRRADFQSRLSSREIAEWEEYFAARDEADDP